MISCLVNHIFMFVRFPKHGFGINMVTGSAPPDFHGDNELCTMNTQQTLQSACVLLWKLVFKLYENQLNCSNLYD